MADESDPRHHRKCFGNPYVNSTLIYADDAREGQQASEERASGRGYGDTRRTSPGQWIWTWHRAGRFQHADRSQSGSASSHVWRGAVPATGAATWQTSAGAVSGRPCPTSPSTPWRSTPLAPNLYIATDVSVYRTTNGGTTDAIQPGAPEPPHVRYEVPIAAGCCAPRRTAEGCGAQARRRACRT